MSILVLNFKISFNRGKRMSEWKKVKIGDFLTEREGRYKPDDSKISKYKRLDKIDFSGTIHISDKPTKTDMIIVHPGDLVISGINVAKGAVAVYQGDEPVCATIHYSSYTFDSSKVDLDYFKYFVKSPAFIAALQKRVKGGIKTEIKPKHLLPLEISIPDLQTQQEIVKKISLQLKKTEQLSVEIESQKNYIKQLRQNILQEAIEGKLTAVWRKQNPVQKGNPDYDAEALFEQIQKERNNEKKQKELSPITDEEKPFEIPGGWKWVRLGDISDIVRGGSPRPAGDKNYYDGKIPFLKVADITNSDEKELWTYTYTIKEAGLKKTRFVEKETLMLTNSGATLGIPKICMIATTFNDGIAAFLDIKNRITKEYLYYFLKSKTQWFLKEAAKGQGQPNLNTDIISSTVFALPPLTEQKEVVTLVEKHLQTISDLENQITEREQLTKQLMQSILKDAFEEKKIDFTRV